MSVTIVVEGAYFLSEMFDSVLTLADFPKWLIITVVVIAALPLVASLLSCVGFKQSSKRITDNILWSCFDDLLLFVDSGNSKSTSTTNTCCSMVLAIAALVFAVMIFNHSKSFSEKSENSLTLAIQRYPSGSRSEKKMIDDVQSLMKCCGVHDRDEWLKSSYGKIPESCCEDYAGTGQCIHFYDRPCLPEIEDRLTYRLYLVGVMGITLGVFELMAFVAACCTLAFAYSLINSDDDSV